MDVRIFYSRAKLFVNYVKKNNNNNKENKKETKSQKQAREYMIASVGVDARNRSLVVVGALDWPSYCSSDSASRMYPVKNQNDSIIKAS